MNQGGIVPSRGEMKARLLEERVIALEAKVAELSTSTNTTKAEIKPCENDNCVNYSEDYDYNCCYFMDCKERV